MSLTPTAGWKHAVAVLLLAWAMAPAHASESTGYVSLDSLPWTNVYENGEFVGATPLFKQRVSAGRHTFTLVNEDANVEQTVTVALEAGNTLAVSVNAQGPTTQVETEVVVPTRPTPNPANEPVANMLGRAQRAYQGLRFDQALSVGRALVLRADATREQRREAFRLWGSAAAIVLEPADAEIPFRMLLREEPEFELSPKTAPKILGVFQQVQREERATALTPRERYRARIVAGLWLTGGVPAEAVGGQPLKLKYDVHDPTQAVAHVRAFYRRDWHDTFSVVPFKRGSNGDWSAVLEPQQLASDEPFRLEYFAQAEDVDGRLLATGSCENPQRIWVSAGVPQHTLLGLKPATLQILRVGLLTGVAVGASAWGTGIGYAINSSLHRELDAAPQTLRIADESYARGDAAEKLRAATWALASLSALTLALTLVTAAASEVSDGAR